MKETKIAKQHIKSLKDKLLVNKAYCIEHKQTCQRWLEFSIEVFGEDGFNETEGFDMIMKGKITDLKQAIKIYGDNGI